MDVAQILVGAVLADGVHERGDLQLRAVRFDAPQLVLKDIVVAADFQIRSVGEVAVDRQLEELRNGQRCAERRPSAPGQIGTRKRPAADALRLAKTDVAAIVFRGRPVVHCPAQPI